MIELALLLKATLAFAYAAWGVLLVEGDVCAAAVGVPVLLLLAAAVSRARGKRAEGWP